MTFDQLSNIFIEWGFLIRPDQYEGFRTYLEGMMKRNRVMFISDDYGVAAIITFFLTNDYDKLYKKSMWAIPEDEPEGSQIYIDKLICKKMTLALRRKIQDTVEDYFPNVRDGYYHRAPFDRCVRIYKRGTKLCTA